MTVSELMSDLAQLGEALSSPQELLAELGDGIVTRMKTQVPVDSHDLRNSIEWKFTAENAITFSMLEYGVFLNYGVTGSEGMNPNGNPKPFTNDFGGLRAPYPAPEFGMGSGYQQPRRFGMMARKFYDELQIQEYIGEQFLEDITVNF